MKIKLSLTIIWLSLTFAAWGQSRSEAQMTIKVVDDYGKPLPGMLVKIGTYVRTMPGTGQDVYEGPQGRTDTNGLVTLTGTSIDGRFSYGIPPVEGYYYTRGFEYKFKEVKDGKWQPWNPTLELVLKPIVNPVPAYANHVVLSLPKIGLPVGYDMTVGDWVAPYGKGVISDFIFRLERKPDRTVKTDDYYKREVKLFDATLTVSFSNEEDGIQSVWAKSHVGSELRLPRYAPEGGYQPQLVKHTYRESADKQIITDTKEDQNYFFRVRTVKKDGKIISTLYGKIDGELDFDVINSPTAIVVFTYNLNPEANSRNMEFDPKRNLFKNLKPSEHVSMP